MAVFYHQQSFKTHSRLNSISFEKEDVLKIMRNLNVNQLMALIISLYEC